MTNRGLECSSCPANTTTTITSGERSVNHSDLKDFTSLDIQGFFNVKIEKGEFAVEIDGPEAERRRYEVYVSGETLVIDYDDDRKSFWKRRLNDDEIRITVTMPELRDLDVKGAGKLKFRGFDEEEVNVKFMGAVVGEGDLTANTLNVELTGASFLIFQAAANFSKQTLSALRVFAHTDTK